MKINKSKCKEKKGKHTVINRRVLGSFHDHLKILVYENVADIFCSVASV